MVAGTVGWINGGKTSPSVALSDPWGVSLDSSSSLPYSLILEEKILRNFLRKIST